MANIIDPDIDFAEYRFLGMQESQWIRPPRDFLDDVLDRRDAKGTHRGEQIPWQDVDWFHFRPGEVTNWLGYNHHGKSRIAGQVCAWLLHHSRHVVASLEMPCSATVHRMIQQCAGRLDYTDDYARQWADYTDGKLWLYDRQERIDAERIVGLVHYSAIELRANHVWIDSLMQCGMSGETRDIYVRQADFIDELCRAAKHLQVHVHLVHHLRKPPDPKAEERMPNRYDARGAGELTDRVDNVILVHRNVAKFRAMESENPPDDVETFRDGTLIIDKQRHGEGANITGIVRMWDHRCGQWMTRNTTQPMLWQMPRTPGEDDDKE